MTAALPIPLEALEDCGAILGRRGAGKSGTRTLLLEHELDRGRRCCLIDPKGDSWGIRLDPDRGPSRFQKVYIFGGHHGDVALEDHKGETIGRLVATHDLSCIVDLSAFSVAGMRRFTRDFAAALFEHNRAPLTLFVDEADQLAPQRVPAEVAMLLHHMESLIRQGRQRGIFMWMLTQRPQVLNKNLLSQAESLVAMRMTTPHDRKAIAEWMEAHDPERAKEVLATLAKLDIGEAWVWVPAADFLERLQLPLFSTFDSMRTPRHGERIEAVKLPPIDRREIEALLGEAGERTRVETASAAYDAGAEVGQLLVEKDARIRELEGELEAVRRDAADWQSWAHMLAEHHRGNIRLSQRTVEDFEAWVARGEGSDKAAAGDRGDEGSSPPSRDTGGGEARAPGKRTGERASPATPQAEHERDLVRGRKALAALLAWNIGLTEQQWAWVGGFSRKGGTWGTYKSALRVAGLVEKRDGKWWPTPAGYAVEGLEELGPFPALGPELVRAWKAKIPGVGCMVDVLLDRWPEWTLRANLADALNMAATGGTFGTYLSRLRSAGLTEEQGKKIRLNPAAMGEADG